MALTAYCKKCKREVEAAEVCPYCGSRLGRTAAHAAWCVEKTPVRDWMSWNSVMRLLVPASLVILAAVLTAEWIAGGPGAVELLIRNRFLTILGILLGAVLAAVTLLLAVQGKELADYVIDNRGIHEVRYLPNPTPLKLLARLKSPALMKNADPEASVPVLKIGETDLAWKDVARVQIWPEKCMILFYAPAWWLRISVACTPFVWQDAMDYIRDKIGKKKKIRLPASLVVTAPPAARRAKPKARLVPEVEEAIGQIRMEELMRESPAESPVETPADALPESWDNMASGSDE